MSKLSILLIATIFLLTKNSIGQQNTTYAIDEKLKKCQEKDGSTIGIVECTDSATKEWDGELNKYYKLLLTKLTATEQQALREAQRQWVSFKEKEANFYLKAYGSKDGSMWNIVIADKKMEIVRQRAIELMNYYELLTQK